MIRLEVKTRLSIEEALARAVRFFGPGGLGLEVKEQDACRVRLEGGGGEVEVYACQQGRDTRVELTSREWDNQVKDFSRKLRR